MTERLAQNLKLRRFQGDAQVSGVGRAEVMSKKAVLARIESRITSYKDSIQLFILSKITNELPSPDIPIDNWTIPQH